MSNYCDLFIFIFIFLKSYVHCFYGTRNSMHLNDMAKTKPINQNNYNKGKTINPISSIATNMCRSAAEAIKACERVVKQSRKDNNLREIIRVRN